MNITNHIWQNALRDVHEDGHDQIIRGRQVREIICRKTITPMSAPVVTVINRKLGYRFMPAEALWILSGDDRVDSISPYSKRITAFSDDGHIFFGAYGPKVVDQIPYVLRALMMDAWTRQAVINIWRESPKPTKDVPCTLSLQFLHRGGKLHCVVSMRSSDLWLGWPYDVFNFSMISAYILINLRLANSFFNSSTLGDLHLTAGSSHIYHDNLIDARNISKSEDYWEYQPISTHDFKSPECLKDHLRVIRDQRWDDLKHPFLAELETLSHEHKNSNTDRPA